MEDDPFYWGWEFVSQFLCRLRWIAGQPERASWGKVKPHFPMVRRIYLNTYR
jgi:hypothetical protein